MKNTVGKISQVNNYSFLFMCQALKQNIEEPQFQRLINLLPANLY